MREKIDEIKFAVVQSGCAIFGAGHTRKAAALDAVEWVADVGCVADVESILVDKHNAVDGDFYMIGSDSDEFDDYMENQGAYEKIEGKWYLI